MTIYKNIYVILLKMNIIINWLISALTIALTAYILPGITISNFITALLVALVLGIVNAFIRPILIILTLPINILTLGLFTFVINALLVLLVAQIVPGFKVASFWNALLFAIVLATINWFVFLVFP